MMNTAVKITVMALCTLVIMGIALSAVGQTTAVKEHPVKVEDGICSNCHEDKAAMDHGPDWYEVHRYPASANEQICGVCHKVSYCVDCHALSDEIKPSDKYKDSPWRSMPHRGDYMSQHKIDGRINPAKCFRCHGRQNNARCRTCHN